MMPAGVEVLSLHEIGFEAEIDETGETLEENSLIKAQTVWEWMNGDASLNGGLMIDGVFADDTGLEIDALNGEPGGRASIPRGGIKGTQTAPLTEHRPLR